MSSSSASSSGSGSACRLAQPLTASHRHPTSNMAPQGAVAQHTNTSDTPHQINRNASPRRICRLAWTRTRARYRTCPCRGGTGGGTGTARAVPRHAHPRCASCTAGHPGCDSGSKFVVENVVRGKVRGSVNTRHSQASMLQLLHSILHAPHTAQARPTLQPTSPSEKTVPHLNSTSSS